MFGQVQPANVTLGSDQQQQFVLQGYGPVSWSVNPIGMGTISPSGLYTAPALTSSAGIVFIYATTSSGLFSAMVHLNQSGPSPVFSPASAAAPSPAFPTSNPSPTPNPYPTPTVGQSPTPTPNPFLGPGPMPNPSPDAGPSPSPSPGPSPSPFPGPAVGPGSGSPTPLTSISLNPAFSQIQPGDSVQFLAMLQGTTNPAIQWSLSPSVGTLMNGVYTAPSSVSGDTQVTITATTLSNPPSAATAMVLILQPVTPVSISLSAGTTSLTAGQSVNLRASVTGTANTAVNWMLTPNMGTISNGVYTAPASVTVQQNVVVTATSQADPTKSATVALLLKPMPTLPGNSTVSITTSPASTTLNGGQSVTFTATVSGTSNTSVNWSLNPSVGTITKGVYQAPAIIGSQQTVTITATSVADSTESATSTVSLVPVSITIAPTSVSLAPGKSATFSASVSGTGNTAVNWSLSPAAGTIVNGVYTAPATVAAAQSVTITATSLADSTKTAIATVSLTPSSSGSSANGNPTPTSPVTLPVEVMGPAGTTGSVSVTVPSGSNLSGPLTLWMQIHGLKYDTEASVQVNNSAWLPISTANVTLTPLEAAYGGIGGGFHTLALTMNLPAGVVVAGTNTITFQFNGTNGVTSGFRVLQFNIQSAGNNLISSSQFVQDDPNTWQPPSSAAADIAAGQTLWQTGALTKPTSSGPVPIQAHCGDCHSQDGRDLKYFNYSNYSIEARSEFHGLTATQGAQIASYIRSLNIPNPGRPWNPPYQPGPGMDSQPVANWSAGAGLSAVLDSDADMQAYLLPGGSSAGWAATSYLDVRELPIPLQLPDWNSWLPTVHPTDAFGATFTSSGVNTFYQKLRGELQPNSASSYANASSDFGNWFTANDYFLVPVESNANWNSTFVSEVYSFKQWVMVKDWELNQEFGLESMPQVNFGAKANTRGWIGNMAFNTSPDILGIPQASPGLGNGGLPVWAYSAYMWYHVQLILNDGQGQEDGANPIDYGYTVAIVKTLSLDSGGTPAASLQLMWLIKALQEYTLNGVGPQVTNSVAAFVPTAPAAYTLTNVNWMSDFSATSPATQVSLVTDYLIPWFAEISSFTNQDYYEGKDGNGRPWASPTENPQTDVDAVTFGGQVWNMLPRMRYLGVGTTVLQPIYNWATQLWPGGNWALNLAATCTNLGSCTSD
jgi:hypothetical protein